MFRLFKIPLLFVISYAVKVTTTAPHPPPTQAEQAPSNAFEGIIQVRSPRRVVQLASWAVSVAETASIIYLFTSPSYSPSNPPSWLSYLGWTGDLSRVSFNATFLVGAFFACLGAYIRWSSYKALGHLFTFEMSIKKDHRLVKDGPYRVVRHPGYLALLLDLGGAFLAFSGPGSWARESGFLTSWTGRPLFIIASAIPIFITFGLIRRVPNEDEALHKAFGKEWEDWAKEVPYKLIPFVY
ncbi:hypothetical protein FA15DRAFT_639947 [Coprinopsis marcescibilis]|uniref:Protein-S-isoprenylcysteine O-methyltransferase n=1 Tax=Coprinopsis marcescibilis TaxID=230819 RepID=A0A5C3KY81_COPMA|nr:hypothetical protein FA15DRAFT_639947 [Coprinopsis marcescibilis]